MREVLHHLLPKVFSMGFLLEALAPGKVSTVSGFKGVKDLNIVKMTATSLILQEVLWEYLREAGRLSEVGLGQWLLEFSRRLVRDRLVGTNTALGYFMLVLPLNYCLALKSSRISGEVGVSKVLLEEIRRCDVSNPLRRENASKLYEALRLAGVGRKWRYVGRVADIYGDLRELSAWEVLKESSAWDLVSHEVVSKYPLTLKVLSLMLKERPEVSDLSILQVISRTQRFLASNHLDTQVMKERGILHAEMVRALASSIDTPETAQRVDEFLRRESINLGSLSDIIAAGTSLYLLVMYLENSRSK